MKTLSFAVTTLCGLCGLKCIKIWLLALKIRSQPFAGLNPIMVSVLSLQIVTILCGPCGHLLLWYTNKSELVYEKKNCAVIVKYGNF